MTTHNDNNTIIMVINNIRTTLNIRTRMISRTRTMVSIRASIRVIRVRTAGLLRNTIITAMEDIISIIDEYCIVINDIEV